MNKIAEFNYKQFDMKKPPVRQWPILRWVVNTVGALNLKKHHQIIEKINTENLKAPYILLCNHNAFYDFFVASKAIYPARANYVVAIDGYTMPIGKRFISREWIMRKVGCICKRKFTDDISLIRHIRTVLENKDVAVIYPEARYSLCGTKAVLPESLGKLCKLFKVPVVTLICHGHHVNSPFWRLGDQKVPTKAEFKVLFTTEELAKSTVEEINQKINETFVYDDFKWQKENKISITDENRAKGLHKVLYQCPHCKTEYKMSSEGTVLKCNSCGKEWEMTEFGELKAKNGETEFSHIPDWYEWERKNVRAEVENGTYGKTIACHAKSLPNSKGYIDIGNGTLTHDMNGFRVCVNGKFGEMKMEKKVESLYSCHIEYEYLGMYGDCVDLNTTTETWYIYPEDEDFSVTKMALATEELYQHWEKTKKN